MNDIGPLRAYYRTVLPYYDQSLEARGDLPFWKSIAARWNPENILELGCGTGRVTQVLTGHAPVIAIDVLVEMLDRATQNAPNAKRVAEDLRELALRSQFDLIVLADDPMAHLTSTDDRRKAIEAIREHLTADGRFVLEGLYRPRREAAVISRSGVEEAWKPVGPESLWHVTYRFDHTQATSLVRSWTREEIDHLPLRVESLWGDFDERAFERESPRMIIVARRA